MRTGVISAADCKPGSRFLLFSGNRLVLRGGETGEQRFWSFEELEKMGLSSCLCAPVADSTGAACAVMHLPEGSVEPSGSELVSTRRLLLQEHEVFDAAQLLARGAQLSNWLRTHRYCGSCGSPTRPGRSLSSEHVLSCDSCDQHFYPRINPCVIVLVTRGREVLLARSAQRNAQFYSCLAGFIEVAETPEQAAEREVFEETGIRISNLRYFGSQPWPFPSQLMLGYHADYAGGDLRLDEHEIAEAAWFDVEDLPLTPAANISVAGKLINSYKESVL